MKDKRVSAISVIICFQNRRYEKLKGDKSVTPVTESPDTLTTAGTAMYSISPI